MHNRYGDIFRFYTGSKLFVVVAQAEDARRILTASPLRERDDYFTRPMKVFIGDGLFTSKGDLWKRHRKILEVIGNSKLVERYLDAFNDGGRFICDLLSATHGVEVDVYKLLFQCTLHTVMFTISGVGLESLEPDVCKQSQLSDDVTNTLKAFQKKIFRPFTWLDLVMWVLPVGQEFAELANRAISFMEKNRRLKEGRKIVSDVLTEAFDELTASEVYDEVRTLGLAGSEPPATALAFALALLGLHPQWQDAAQQELDAVFGTGSDYLRPVTADDLAQLPVIESIIKETLRLFPPAANLPHFASEDIPLAGGRYVAPRGSCVFVSLYLLHRQPDVFPDPDKFDPGRFLADKGSCYSSYYPFGAGSRKCIGARFAILEMKTVLAVVLRRFRVLPGSTRQELEDIVLSITSHPLTGFRITCVPRDNLPSTLA